jgi:hypothetical protein
VKILILGGTRFIGKELATKLSASNKFIVDIFSKKKTNIKKINKQYLGNIDNKYIKSKEKYDVIIDFISKKKKHIENIIKNFNFDTYVYVSTIWVDKKKKYNNTNGYNYRSEYLSIDTTNYINDKIKIEGLLKKKISKKLKILRLPLIFSKNTPRIQYYITRIFYGKKIIFSTNLNKTYLFYADVQSIIKFLIQFITSVNSYKNKIYYVISGRISFLIFIKTISNLLKKNLSLHLYPKSFLLKCKKKYLYAEPFINEYLINFSNKNLIKLKSSFSIRSIVKENIKNFNKINA